MILISLDVLKLFKDYLVGFSLCFHRALDTLSTKTKKIKSYKDPKKITDTECDLLKLFMIEETNFAVSR